MHIPVADAAAASATNIYGPLPGLQKEPTQEPTHVQLEPLPQQDTDPQAESSFYIVSPGRLSEASGEEPTHVEFEPLAQGDPDPSIAAQVIQNPGISPQGERTFYIDSPGRLSEDVASLYERVPFLKDLSDHDFFSLCCHVVRLEGGLGYFIDTKMINLLLACSRMNLSGKEDFYKVIEHENSFSSGHCFQTRATDIVNKFNMKGVSFYVVKAGYEKHSTKLYIGRDTYGVFCHYIDLGPGVQAFGEITTDVEKVKFHKYRIKKEFSNLEPGPRAPLNLLITKVLEAKGKSLKPNVAIANICNILEQFYYKGVANLVPSIRVQTMPYCTSESFFGALRIYSHYHQQGDYSRDDEVRQLKLIVSVLIEYARVKSRKSKLSVALHTKEMSKLKDLLISGTKGRNKQELNLYELMTNKMEEELDLLYSVYCSFGGTIYI